MLVGLVAMMSLLVSAIGASPAAAKTQTVWVPLHCSVGGVVPVRFGVALTATFPESVVPAERFHLTGVTPKVILGRNAQAGGAVFSADAIQGIVTDFQVNLTNASVNFATTTGGNPVQTSPTQFNSVLAVQPPNQPAVVGPSGPRINGGDTTRGGFQPSTPAESFSFGDVPVDTSGASGNRYGPVPGVGGGPNPTDGTPDALPPIGPITVTGAVGDTLVIRNANPGGPPVMTIESQNVGPRMATTTIAYHEGGSGNPGTYRTLLPMDCAPDTTRLAVPNPMPGVWVSEFSIPIEGGPTDGVGTTSARGALESGALDVQFSAITNCDETANTRPFYVRWEPLGGTTHIFRRTSTHTSTCTSSDTTDTNQGTGSGTVDGTTNASLSWVFRNDDQPNEDSVSITVDPDGPGLLSISLEPPGSLSGTPGGVWVFGTLPWPAGT